MTGQRDECAPVVGEDVVQEIFQTCFLRRIGFAHVGFPQGIVFGETGFERVVREGALDVGFAAASIAGMDSYCFAQELYIYPTL